LQSWGKIQFSYNAENITIIDFIDQAKRNMIAKLLASTWKNNKYTLAAMYSAEYKTNYDTYVM
jgi:hypothetical protein